MPWEPPPLRTMCRCTPASECATAKKPAPTLSISSGRTASRWSAHVSPCGATIANGSTAPASTAAPAPSPGRDRPPAPALPQLEERERQQQHRIHLGRSAGGGQRAGERAPPVQERGDGADREHRGPVVEVEERDRPEYRRRHTGGAEHEVGAATRRAEPRERPGHRGEREQREDEDLDAEPEEVRPVIPEELAQVHGGDERRQRAGWILDVEVAVRHQVRGHPAAPALVVAGVAEQPHAEHRREGDERPRGDEQAGAEQRGPAQVSRRQERAAAARVGVHRRGHGRGLPRPARARRWRRTGRPRGCTCRASTSGRSRSRRGAPR